MKPAITFEELLGWDCETSDFWNAHLEAHPALLDLPCSIGGTTNVQELVRHIWSVELRWAQRLAALPELAKEATPTGPLPVLFHLHFEAIQIFGKLLADPSQDWEAPFVLKIPSIPPDARTVSRRKVLGHALLHSQRHWAQLATLVRLAGFPSNFAGDLLLSRALR